MQQGELRLAVWAYIILKKWKDVSMPKRPFIQLNERTYPMEQNTGIMLQLADLLFQDNLITSEEKYHLKQLITQRDSV